jgi:hypothetical protein
MERWLGEMLGSEYDKIIGSEIVHRRENKLNI